MSVQKQSKTAPIQWSYDKYLTPQEFIVQLYELINDPLDNLMQMDGDMYLSDYRKLMDAKWRMHHAMRDLKEKGVI
tara:strand:+ start:937 stop:1164 length:228 start_codon:yes stop_codon:yes gene_type:complete